MNINIYWSIEGGKGPVLSTRNVKIRTRVSYTLVANLTDGVTVETRGKEFFQCCGIKVVRWDNENVSKFLLDEKGAWRNDCEGFSDDWIYRDGHAGNIYVMSQMDLMVRYAEAIAGIELE